ncbi:MAG: OmpA family protein [Saprospiraceae bacterium]|nr:OmpA family protein [Saprospiraceae bacterium]
MIEKKTSLDIPGVSIMDAKIEIYNNTTEKQVLTIDKSDSPHFNYFLEEGNHYTIMIRKEGYFVKRIEAFVNVKGCILCMEEMNTINNGLSDNLTQGHKKGVIQASIELAPLRLNETMKIENIYYDYNQFFIRKEAGKELDKIVTLLKNNPGIQVELGSHTDSRGNDEYNLELSDNRAKAAVEYIIKNGIDKNRILSKGYGETKLTNRCKDGVVCSEAEHQNNRRTELKILGIKKDPNDEKTLEEIIRYENIDKKLAEIENQKTIEVVEGQDIKEAINNAETIAKQKNWLKSSCQLNFITIMNSTQVGIIAILLKLMFLNLLIQN